MVFIKKVTLWSAAGLGMTVVFLLVWLNLPVQAPDLAGFMPEETFMFTSLAINPGDRGMRDFMNNLVEGKGKKNKILLKYGLSLCLPLKAAVFFNSVPGEENFPYLFLVQSPRLVKVVKLLHLLGIKLSSDYSFTVFRNTLLLSANPSLIERSIGIYNKKGNRYSISGKAKEAFLRKRSSGEIIFFADNTDLFFSLLVDRLEDKLSYILLTSSGELEGIEGYVKVVDEDRVEVNLIFKYGERNDLKKAEDDIFFLTGVLLRLGQANDLALDKKVTVENGNLTLIMEVSGLKSLAFEKGLIWLGKLSRGFSS